MTRWEQTKRHALEMLKEFLDNWQGREFDGINKSGKDANTAVLALDLNVDLPLPYDEDKMRIKVKSPLTGKIKKEIVAKLPVLIQSTFARDRGKKPDDDVAKNIKAWIRFLGEAVPGDDPSKDPSLIQQSRIEVEYDLKATTLYKYSQKKPGDVNYLWSVQGKHKHRYYRRKDLDILKQSQIKTSGI